jgi:FimV-like protein
MKYLLASLFFVISTISADSLISSPKITTNETGLRVIELKIKDNNLNDKDIKLLEYRSEEGIDAEKIEYTILKDNDTYYEYLIALSGSYSSDYFNFKIKIKDDFSKDIFIFLPSINRSSFDDRKKSTTVTSINPLSKVLDDDEARPAVGIKPKIQKPIEDPSFSGKTIPAGDIKTMWSLATDIAKSSDDLSIYQIMWSIYLGNPSAFINENINLVRDDIDIIVPSYEVMSRNSSSDSKAAILRMNKSFSLDFRTPAKSLLTLTAPKINKENELNLVKDNEDGKVDLVSIESISNSPKDIISQNTSTLVIKTNNQTIDDLVEISVAEEEEKSSEFNFIDLLFVAGISALCGVFLSLIFIQLNKNRRKTVVYDFDEAPSSGPETQALPSGLSIKNNKDEQELDLASTYIEMGELEQAHIILRNIVKKSENKAAKEKASELISLIQSK